MEIELFWKGFFLFCIVKLNIQLTGDKDKRSHPNCKITGQASVEDTVHGGGG